MRALLTESSESSDRLRRLGQARQGEQRPISFVAGDESTKTVFATSESSDYETNIHLGELRHT